MGFTNGPDFNERMFGTGITNQQKKRERESFEESVTRVENEQVF
jgi:hypothetical protein